MNRNLIAATTISVLAPALGATSAQAAATYAVDTCRVSGTNNAWFAARTAPASHLAAVSACSTEAPDPYGSMERGVGILDVLWGATPPGGELLGAEGRWAEVRFTAPERVRIRNAEINREVGHRYEAWTSYGRVDSVDVPGDMCELGVFDILCRRTGTVVYGNLDARELAYGARCRTSWLECDVGATAHHVWALVLEARVTLEDLEAPVVGALEVGGLNDGGWHRGGGSLVFSASDNTGVRERRLVEGEVVRAVARAPSASAGGCFGGTGVAYTYTQPCAGSRGINGRQSISVSSVCSWGDGVHSIRGSATDTGGGTSLTAAVAVKVDCSAPSTSVDAGPATRTAGLTLEPLVATQDAASGVAATTTELSTDGGTWTAYEAPVTAVAGQTYRFRARGTDAAGNVGSWAYSDVVTGVEPTQPEPAEEPARPTDVVPATEHPTTPPPPASQPRSESPTLVPLAEPAPPPVTLKVQRLDPQLRIVRTKSARRSLTIAGAVATGYADRITVRVTTRGRTVTRHISPRGGRWSVRLRRPVRGTARIVVTAAAGARFTSARAVASVR